MSLLVRSALLLVLALPAAAAAPPFFGEPFPLTNTRYTATTGVPTLASNGTTLLVAWTAEQSVRVTRLVDGQRTTSHYVLPTYGWQDDVAVAWTGSFFVVAASSEIDGLPVIMGRRLDANGTPVGQPFPIQLNATAPRLASSGSRTMMAYREATTSDVYARVLQPDGTVAIGSITQKIASRAAFGPLFDIATNGSGFMAVASSPVEVLLARFDANGAFLGTRLLAGSQGTSRPRPTAIAANGSDYLAVWFDFTRVGVATLIDANGAPLPTIIFDEIVGSPTPIFLAPRAVWKGGGWAVSYAYQVQINQRMRIAHLDAGARVVTAREPEVPIATGASATSSLLRQGNAVRAVWNADRFPNPGAMAVATLPLTFAAGSFFNLDAPDQTLLAAAGTATTGVFLWNETTDRDSTTFLSTGDLAGTYDQRALPFAAEWATAVAGDGFLLVLRSSEGSIALRLDDNGVPVGLPIDLDFRPTSAAWNGAIWAIAGEKDDSVVAYELTPAGVLSTPKTIRQGADSPQIASMGTDFLMVWRMDGPCAPPCFPPSIIRGARLDAQRTRIDGFDLDFSPALHAESPAVAWNPDSAQYVIGWIDTEEIVTRQVEPNGSISPSNNRLHIGLEPQRDLSMLTTAGTVALTWTDDEVTRAAFLNVVGNIEKMFVFPHAGSHTAGAPRLVNLPQNHTGVAFAELMKGSPHYGAMRVLLALSTQFLPGVTDRPSIAAQLLPNGEIQVSWTTPDRFVNGFRLERRVGDGVWLEIDKFYEPVIRSDVFVRANSEPHAFRVRALGDDGISEYSNEAIVTFTPPPPPPPPPPPAKRRSVRK
jgi:hypothetical protein